MLFWLTKAWGWMCSCVSHPSLWQQRQGWARRLKVGECSDFHDWEEAPRLRYSDNECAVCLSVCVFFFHTILPSYSPPCSWLRPAGAAVLPRRWSEAEPAPGPRRREETRTRLWRQPESNFERVIVWIYFFKFIIRNLLSLPHCWEYNLCVRQCILSCLNAEILHQGSRFCFYLTRWTSRVGVLLRQSVITHSLRWRQRQHLCGVYFLQQRSPVSVLPSEHFCRLFYGFSLLGLVFIDFGFCNYLLFFFIVLLFVSGHFCCSHTIDFCQTTKLSKAVRGGSGCSRF